MPVLVLAPVLEVLEDGVHLVLWVRLEVPEDGDVPPVPNLLGQVGGVEDELGLEEGVLPSLGQETQVQRQVEVRQTLVQEPIDSTNCKKLSAQIIHGLIITPKTSN